MLPLPIIIYIPTYIPQVCSSLAKSFSNFLASTSTPLRTYLNIYTHLLIDMSFKYTFRYLLIWLTFPKAVKLMDKADIATNQIRFPFKRTLYIAVWNAYIHIYIHMPLLWWNTIKMKDIACIQSNFRQL